MFGRALLPVLGGLKLLREEVVLWTMAGAKDLGCFAGGEESALFQLSYVWFMAEFGRSGRHVVLQLFIKLTIDVQFFCVFEKKKDNYIDI